MVAPSCIRSAFGLVLASCVALSASGCAITRPDAATPSTGATRTVVSAVKNADRTDLAAAEKSVFAYIDALRSADASAAAALMTSYRRAETKAKGWNAEIGWWKDARVKAVLHPGRYLGDERTFAQLYAERFGHPPYKLVVINVSYGLGPGVPPGDIDFVVTQDSSTAPWLVHDFGGALRPAPAPASVP